MIGLIVAILLVSATQTTAEEYNASPESSSVTRDSYYDNRSERTGYGISRDSKRTDYYDTRWRHRGYSTRDGNRTNYFDNGGRRTGYSVRGGGYRSR